MADGPGGVIGDAPNLPPIGSKRLRQPGVAGDQVYLRGGVIRVDAGEQVFKQVPRPGLDHGGAIEGRRVPCSLRGLHSNGRVYRFPGCLHRIERK